MNRLSSPRLSLGVRSICLCLIVSAGLACEASPRARGPESFEALPPHDPDRVAEQFIEWVAAHEAKGGDRALEIGLGWSKGLSSEFTSARGVAILDLLEGTVWIEVDGGAELIEGGVWVIDNTPRPGGTVGPEAGDHWISLGTVEMGPGATGRTFEVPGLPDFEVDLVVVTRAGEHPIDGGILFGSAPLFSRLYSSMRREGRSTQSIAAEIPQMVERGRRLFFEETFGGNGRTCGTCHPAENNLTIDARFIATLPADDPLFVAEFVPALRDNFEKPELMRRLGLILENLDGFEDLENRFVMRGVPHTLALGTSLLPAPAEGGDGTVTPPDQRTGWSGDGSPGSGTLREFAIGAVRQHFTRTLAREPGIDFRFPTEAELDDLEAFQLSTGREADVDLGALVPRDPVAARGRELFLAVDTQNGTVAAAKCQLCHANGGATFGGAPGGFNFNFATGVEALVDRPADLIDGENNPPDGGFGVDPLPGRPGAFGDGTFNTPPLIEAADTPPFFHDHSVATIEGAVAFYNGAAFSESPSGQLLASLDSAGIGIVLAATEVEAVAAFLRVLNALENLRAAEAELERALAASTRKVSKRHLRSAFPELEDTIEVLEGGSLHPEVVARLDAIAGRLTLLCTSPRRTQIERLLGDLEQARELLVE